jgi:hypothetical protein
LLERSFARDARLHETAGGETRCEMTEDWRRRESIMAEKTFHVHRCSYQ